MRDYATASEHARVTAKKNASGRQQAEQCQTHDAREGRLLHKKKPAV
jgi:hypothetical protein